MKFSYNWLQSYFQKKLPAPEKLAEILTLHFAEVEDVKKEGSDFVLNIDVRPNRAGDCFSHNGVAREISAILNLNLKSDKRKLIEDKKLRAKNFVDIVLLGRGPCARYTARVVSGIKIGPSPKWMQDRLISCGLRPINNVVDISNYVMLETGQPLHAFDAEKIAEKRIIVRFAKLREKIITLDGSKIDLNDDILVIADSQSPLAIAGIKGGQGPEIDKNTKTVIIESANFNSQVIRRASKKIGLRTDASLRFEHGLDPNLTESAADRAAFLVRNIAGGKIAKGRVDVYPKEVLPKIIKLDQKYVKSLLGTEIPPERIKSILENLGFEMKGLNVVVPTRRMDICLQEDLIEEIGRIFGYEKIPAVLPKTSLAIPKINQDILWENIAKDALKEAVFNEIVNYSFVSQKEASFLGYKSGEMVEVSNPLSDEYQYLRPTLMAGLLKNLERNQKNFPQIKIFEMGKVFQPPKTEIKMITGLLSGDKFYEAKGSIDLVLNRMGISEVWYDEYRTPEQESKIFRFHPEKCAEIKIGEERVGFLGEISAKIINDYKICQKAVYFDIYFDKLIRLASEEHEYRPISKFPAAVRDIAVLVPSLVKVEEVLNKIEEAGGILVRDIDLFDIYEGENLPGQKKNLAFHIIYQSEDKTLASTEIEEVHNKIINALEKMPEWQVRK